MLHVLVNEPRSSTVVRARSDLEPQMGVSNDAAPLCPIRLEVEESHLRSTNNTAAAHLGRQTRVFHQRALFPQSTTRIDSHCRSEPRRVGTASWSCSRWPEARCGLPEEATGFGWRFGPAGSAPGGSKILSGGTARRVPPGVLSDTLGHPQHTLALTRCPTGWPSAGVGAGLT